MQDSNQTPQTLYTNPTAQPSPTPDVPSLDATTPSLPPLDPQEAPLAEPALTNNLPPLDTTPVSPAADSAPEAPSADLPPVVSDASEAPPAPEAPPIDSPSMDPSSAPAAPLPPLASPPASDSPTPETPAAPASPTANPKLAFLSYLGILVIVPILMKTGDAFIKFHNRQGLLFLIYCIGSNIVLSLPAAFLGSLGSLLVSANGIFVFVLWVMGMLNVSKDETKPLPLIGQFADKLPETWG
ncbi:hypothetical protein FWH30_03465 [Microgenomates group bacterium]|nr:hypothetical protein [Microgenomates group bacterium]